MSELETLNLKIDELIKILQDEASGKPYSNSTSDSKKETTKSDEANYDFKINPQKKDTSPDKKIDTSKKPNKKHYGANPSYNQLDDLPELTGSPNDRVVEAAKFLVNWPDLKEPSCCWDWANKVYYYAGCSCSEVAGSNFYKSYSGHDCGNNHVGENLLNNIQPGDWLYVNNKNTADPNGNHSVIVVQKMSTYLIQASAWLGPGRRAFYDINFQKQPVVLIMKPVNKK